MSEKRHSSRGADRQAIELMSQLVWLVPRIYHSLSGATEETYRQYNLTAGKRSLMSDLNLKGPHTIAEMVRVRPPVTRQYIQRLVSELCEDGLVVLGENPEDRRAKIVSLTEKGRSVLKALRPTEDQLVASLAASHSKADLGAAVQVLQGIVDKLGETSEGAARHATRR